MSISSSVRLLLEIMFQSKNWLYFEFLTIYILAPLSIALFAAENSIFLIHVFIVLVAIGLLCITKDFDWREELSTHKIKYKPVLGFTIISTLVIATIVYLTKPDLLLYYFLNKPLTSFFILLVLSLNVIGLELTYRSLFFQRYGDLLPESTKRQLWLNVILFTLSYAVYWNIWAILLPLFASIIFTYSYIKNSLLQSTILHYIWASVIFLFGMQHVFYV